MNEQANELIQVENLRAKRGDFLLQVPAWTVERGRVVGLVGPNGAGKTTLLETLAGLAPADGGSQRVLGLDPWLEPERTRTRLGIMSDDMPLFAMQVGSLLRMISAYYPSWDHALASELVARFEVDLRRRSDALSKGEGTRLRLVVAMAFRPQILLLDEPATGLDLAGRRKLLKSVLEIVGDEDRSVVISSHLLHDVERIADELLVLDRGNVVAQGTTSALLGDNQNLEEACLAWGLAQ